MALGIKHDPDSLMPVGNILPLVVDSDNSSETNFRYKLIIYRYTDPTYTTISTMYLDPDIDNDGYMVYDLSNIVNNYITDDFTEVKSSGITETNSEINYAYKVQEYIGNSGGTSYLSDAFVTFTGVKQYGDIWDEDIYIPTDAGTFNFLSNKQLRTYKTDTYSTINMYNKNLTLPLKVVYTIYTESTGVQKTVDFPASATTTDRIIYSIPIGPMNITDAGIYTIDSDIVSYTVQIKDSSYTVKSEEIEVVLDHKCYKSDGVEFIYKGSLGTYETIIANYINVKNFNTNFSEIKKSYYAVNSDKYNYSIGDRGREIINRRTQESQQVNTDWLTDTEVTDWLELFNSTESYIRIGTDLYPILITTTNYIEKTIKNEKLFNYTIAFEMTYEKLSI